MASSVPTPSVNESYRTEYDKLVQERDELFQERLRLFGLKPTVYVRNLDPTTTEAELKQWFQQSGPIKEVRLQLDKNGVSTCTAFIEFYYIQSCDDACKRFNEQYRDKSSAQPLQVQLEKKFQIAHQAYKSQGYRLNPAGAPMGQSYDQMNMQPAGPMRGGANQMYMFPQNQQQQHFGGNHHIHHHPQQPQQPHYHNQPQQSNYRNGPNTHQQPHQQQQPQQANQQQQPRPPQAPQTQGQTNPNNIIIAPNGDTNAIYVANLRPDLTLEQVKTVFGEFGMILDMKIVSDKGFAFITYSEINAAKLALGLDGQQNNLISKHNTTLMVQFKGQAQQKRAAV